MSQCREKIECGYATWYCVLEAGHDGQHESVAVPWNYLEDLAEYINRLEREATTA